MNIITNFKEVLWDSDTLKVRVDIKDSYQFRMITDFDELSGFDDLETIIQTSKGLFEIKECERVFSNIKREEYQLRLGEIKKPYSPEHRMSAWYKYCDEPIKETAFHYLDTLPMEWLRICKADACACVGCANVEEKYLEQYLNENNIF